MGFRWGHTLLLVATICTGCVTASDRQYSRSDRQWQALCRAMRAEPTRTGVVTMPDCAARNALRTAADRARPAIVWIATAHPGTAATSSPASSGPRVSAGIGGGSGVFIAPGLVLTNEHVIRDASSMTIVLADGTRYRVEQTAVAARHDLAILRVSCSNACALPLRNSKAERGTGVAAVGGPHFHPSTQCRIGVIERGQTCMQRQLDPQGKRDYARLLQTTAELQPGFSGGPLLDEHGQVIGISVAAGGSGLNARGYAIPIDDDVRAVIDDLCRRVNRHPG